MIHAAGAPRTGRAGRVSVPAGARVRGGAPLKKPAGIIHGAGAPRRGRAGRICNGDVKKFTSPA